MGITIKFTFVCMINGKVYGLRQLQAGEQARRQPDARTFRDAAEEAIRQLEPSRRKSTIDNYRTMLRSFLAYAGSDKTVDSIDSTLIEGYERWLEEHSVRLNTSSCYMRSLRALLARIAPDMDRDRLFANVYTGNAKTDKRSIRTQDIGKLRDLKLPCKSPLRIWRDIFLFCLMALGMPFVDLAFLRKSNIRNGYIEYSRHKTGQRIRVRIERPMQQIINRYAREDSDYVFPILTSTEPTRAMQQYEAARGRYNHALKNLAAMAGLRGLTSYVARHSWATMAYSSGVMLPVISKALGHRSAQTTLTYIREIDDHSVDRANSRLVSQINRPSCSFVKKNN